MDQAGNSGGRSVFLGVVSAPDNLTSWRRNARQTTLGLRSTLLLLGPFTPVLFLCTATSLGQVASQTAAQVDESRASTTVSPFSVSDERIFSSAPPFSSTAVNPQSAIHSPQSNGGFTTSKAKGSPAKFTLGSSVSGGSWIARESERELAEGQASQPSGADGQELAQKLSNPVASLISVPLQFNFDYGLGPEEDGFRFTMNFQPVIPISLNQDWNLISRTILPIMHQSDAIDTTSQSGLGDIVQSFFFSPNKTEPFIWGVGPALLIPTATDELLGTEKFGLGPTVVVLKQQGPWTFGALWSHIWSVAGADDRTDVNGTFLQPFLSYTTRTAWTYTFNLESTYDWEEEQWGVPIHVQVTKLLKFGKQPISLGGGLRSWATSPSGGPQGCGLRFIFTPLFPKG
jgi:hypothetical protein